MNHQTILLLAAVGAGVCFALVGVSYRLAQIKSVPTTGVFATMTLVGSIVFLLRADTSQWAHLPAILFVIAVVGGASQYVVMLLAAALLRRGSLTALWCAVNLGFLVNIVYARVFLAEPILVLHGLAMLAGVACVILAARSHRPVKGIAAVAGAGCPGPSVAGSPAVSPTGSALTHHGGSSATYAVLFLALLLTNTVNPTGLKHLNTQPLACAADTQTQTDAYMAVSYLAMLAFSATHALIRTGPRAWAGWGLPVGALAALGSVVGMGLMAVFTKLPAALGFTTCSAVSILSAGIFGAALFAERRSASWYATIAAALAAVGLVAMAGGTA